MKKVWVLVSTLVLKYGLSICLKYSFNTKYVSNTRILYSNRSQIHFKLLWLFCFVFCLFVCLFAFVLFVKYNKLPQIEVKYSFKIQLVWSVIDFFEQITVQRYFIFVSTVGLRYPETSLHEHNLRMHLEKIEPTYVHFQYNARKLRSLKSVSLWGILRKN